MYLTADTQRVSAASAGLTSLALRLAKQLAATTKTGGNLVFSPLSVYAALALVAAGARGAALDELLALLGSASRDELADLVRRALAKDAPSGGPLIAFACGVWHDAEVVLKPAFRDTAVECFKADVRAVDFKTKAEEARAEINSWAAEATKGLIADVLPRGSVGADTGLMLVNAVYFKGKWEEPFDERCTVAEDFHLLDGRTVQTPLMRGDRGSFLVAEHDGFKVLKLRYQAQAPPPSSFPTFGFGFRTVGGEQLIGQVSRIISRTAPPAKLAGGGGGGSRYALCVFLPDARDGVWSLVDELASAGPAFLHSHLPEKKVLVGKLRLPRFKMTFSGDLTDALRGIGLQATLDPRDRDDGGACDLTDMAAGRRRGGLPGVVPPPRIDKVCHKAVIELNEEGTVAAAVTYVGIPTIGAAPPGYRPKTVDFVADHPFAFFVVEEVSGAVVFAGCVLDPSSQ